MNKKNIKSKKKFKESKYYDYDNIKDLSFFNGKVKKYFEDENITVNAKKKREKKTEKLNRYDDWDTGDELSFGYTRFTSIREKLFEHKIKPLKEDNNKNIEKACKDKNYIYFKSKILNNINDYKLINNAFNSLFIILK